MVSLFSLPQWVVADSTEHITRHSCDVQEILDDCRLGHRWTCGFRYRDHLLLTKLAKHHSILAPDSNSVSLNFGDLTPFNGSLSQSIKIWEDEALRSDFCGHLIMHQTSESPFFDLLPQD